MRRYFKYFSWFLLIVIFSGAAAGCQRGSHNDLPEIEIDMAVSPDPPEVGPATITLTFSDAQGQPVEGAQVELEGNMSHAGMAPVLTEAVEVAPGQYQAPLEFTMGGDWFILVKAALPDGRSLERQINLPGIIGP
jgi:hypothetical protein